MPNAKRRASPAPPAQAEVRGPTSPTTKVLIAGGVVVAGVALLSAIQAKGGLSKIFGAPTTTTTAAQQAALAAPTQAGVTFRSGSIGGFIPISLDSIVSSIFSVFQPSKAEAAQITAPAVGVSLPTPIAQSMAEAMRAEREGAPVEVASSAVVPEILREAQPVQIQADGSFFTAADQGDAGQQFYDSGGGWF